MNKRIFLTFLMAALILSACGQSKPDPALDPVLAMTQAFATVDASFTQTALAIPTNTPAPTETPTNTPPPKPTAFTPTVVLTAVVTTPSNLRFGPSTVYAGPGGVRTGKTLEVIGRNAAGDWLLIREPGGKKSSWIYATNLTVTGDLSTLAIAPVVLIITPNYQAPTNIKAARAADQVQVSWDAVTINYKDAYPESTYFIEAWTCSGGQLTYNIFATKDLAIIIPDQPGCSEPSHGLVHTTTRDGYSAPGEIPWPTP
jgi:hypothetical protein